MDCPENRNRNRGKMVGRYTFWFKYRVKVRSLWGFILAGNSRLKNPSPPHSLAPSLPSLAPSLTPSLPHSLAPSLPRSLSLRPSPIARLQSPVFRLPTLLHLLLQFLFVLHPAVQYIHISPGLLVMVLLHGFVSPEQRHLQVPLHLGCYG